MAKKSAVWGIDIGQCALKALRCTLDGDNVVADAFDYIEYPKILSQPEAEPEELIREALDQFLSRNDIKGCKVAMSVPGQSGLAKFFKPPPVDAKKIPDIVKYEARQQIPFDLDDVIWDYQQMGGGSEVDGFALETEVGLFAMKRDQVFRAIKPFEKAGVELDIVQLAPLGIYNFVTHDLLSEQLAEVEFDPENPPESLVVLSMGTDTTDLVVTNGFRVWQRSIPLGGNHFTKQLTKELKLTFAKAEHLKRNARQAEDPKTVFQAMRSVFNDLVTEVQRSIGYFQSIDRKAKIGGVVVLGNTVKLPGLQQYLAKNLGYEVVNFRGFSRLQGDDVVGSPAFKDNALAFGVCYGLCLQGLGVSNLKTNLVPREIVVQRIIREKKPWALATVGALMLACSFNFFFHYNSWSKVQEGRTVNGVAWSSAEQNVSTVTGQSSTQKTEDQKRVKKIEHLTKIGQEVVGNDDRRKLWLELLRTINQALPRDPDFKPGLIPSVKNKPLTERTNLNIDYMESQYFSKLSDWFNESAQARYRETLGVLEVQAQPALDAAKQIIEQNKEAAPAETAPPAGGGGAAAAGYPDEATGTRLLANLRDLWGEPLRYEVKGQSYLIRSAGPDGEFGSPDDVTAGPDDAAPAAGAPAAGAPATGDAAGGAAAGENAAPVKAPEGAGWVIELQGHHFYNSKDRPNSSGATYVRNTLLKNLETLTVELPIGDGKTERFTMRELGIGYAILLNDGRINWNNNEPNPEFEGAAGAAPAAGAAAGGGFAAGDPFGGGAEAGDDGDDGGENTGEGPPGYGANGDPGGDPPGVSGSGNDDKKPEVPATIQVPKYSFIVQFCWQEQPLKARLKAKQDKREEEMKRLQQLQGQPADVAVAGGNN